MALLSDHSIQRIFQEHKEEAVKAKEETQQVTRRLTVHYEVLI
jgi:hypothetical protein